MARSAAAATRPVAPRRTPHQQRSEARVRDILDVTARLLERTGSDALTTNHIARELGVSVGTLYHYFPNKQAILHALGVEWLDEWQQAFDEIERDSHQPQSLAHFLERAVDRMHEVYVNQRGVLHLVQAMFTIPELHEIDSRGDELAVERLSDMFRRLQIPGGPAERKRLARVYLKVSNAVLLEVVNQPPAASRRTLADLKALLHHHLTRRRP